MERISRKEDFPHERAGEERILTLEGVQDQSRAGGFRTVEFLLANGDNRFDLGGELRVRDDSGSPAVNTANVPFEIPLVGLEPDVL